jgi:ATP-binding cassette subfamily C (CFTR/MRP) protein 1
VLVVLGLQYYFGYLIVKSKEKNAASVSNRVALAQEVLPAMKLVKYYCWEKFFEKELSDMRASEQPMLWKMIVTSANAISLVFTTPPLIAFVTFIAYEFRVGRITSDLAFTTLSLFNTLRFPLVVLPKAIRSASEGYASLKRIEEFLLLPMDHKEVKHSSTAEGNGVFIVSHIPRSPYFLPFLLCNPPLLKYGAYLLLL